MFSTYFCSFLVKFISAGLCCSFLITDFQTGVGIYGDVAKLHHDYGVRIQGIVDLSSMANKKLATDRHSVRQWSLSSLAQELTGKQVWLLSLLICDNDYTVWLWIEPLTEVMYKFLRSDVVTGRQSEECTHRGLGSMSPLTSTTYLCGHRRICILVFISGRASNLKLRSL